MASSKVMANTSTTNSDRPRQQSPSVYPSLPSLLTDQQNHGQSSLITSDPSMDDFLKNIYSSPTPEPNASPYPGSSLPGADETGAGGKSVDDVWKEIVSGGGDHRRGGSGAVEEMTLEDFLAKAGAVREEDVREMGIVPAGAGVVGSYGLDAKSNSQFGNEVPVVDGVGRVGVRGKRRAVEEAPLDKATQQRQRRMIKNRESAARSRERKQAYTVELESLVTQLEEENTRLLKEEADQKKERYKQLMANLIPVIEKQREPRFLRRVHSMQW